MTVSTSSLTSSQRHCLALLRCLFETPRLTWISRSFVFLDTTASPEGFDTIDLTEAMSYSTSQFSTLKSGTRPK